MASAAQPTPSESGERQMDPEIVTVLFVDDDPAFLRLASAVLEDKPLEVLTAEDGQAALEHLQDASVDCIVSDLAMNGIDGFELCAQAKRRHPGVPFLLLTGHVDARTRHRAAQAGADACLRKGTSLDAFDALSDRIRTHADRARVPATQAPEEPHGHNPIAVHDPDTGDLLGANEDHRELIDDAGEAVVGGSPAAHDPGIIQHIREQIQQTPGAPPRAVAWIQEGADGQERRFEGVLERVTIDGHDRVLVTLRDVTGRDDREQTIQAIYGIAADRSLSFQEKVDELMTLGRDVLGTGFATLSRMRGEEYIFEHVQSPGGEIQPGDLVSLRETLCEQAVLNNKTLVVDSPLEASALNREATLELACYLGAPVYIGDQVHGTFCFYDVEPRQRGFTDWEVTLVEMMSQWISLEMERDSAKEELHRENRRLEDLASLMSHDLRSPLAVAMGHVELLQEALDHPSIDEIQEALARTEEIVEDSLTWARTGAAVEATGQASIRDVAHAAWKVVPTPGLELVVETDKAIEADGSRLQQLLENLFRNAYEHGDKAATVTVGGLEDGFFVEDDGVGFRKEVSDTLFDIGQTTSNEGTGFGLSIVKQITDAHGWAIEAVTGRQGGARFEITGVEWVSEQP